MPEPVKKVAGKAAPLEANDVDTDQIIPAQFLKVIERRGLGRYLFYRWRYDEEGRIRGDFILDRPEFKDTRILIAGRNFGIGSSRENAVWSLLDFGIRCVIASSFGDIFYVNSSKNGLVCVRLDDESISALRELAKRGDLELVVDVEKQLVVYPGGEYRFEVEPYIKERLVKGLDDIAITLSRYEGEIRRYEERMPGFLYPRPRSFSPE